MRKLYIASVRSLKKFFYRAMVAAALIMASTRASAQLIGVQFVHNGGSNINQGAANDSPYTGVGVLNESFVAYTFGVTNNGNGLGSGINSGPTELGTSGVYLQTASSSTNDYVAARGTSGNVDDTSTNLYANALEPHNGQTFTFTLSGLSVGQLYDVVLYAGNFGSVDARSLGVTINGASTSGISGSAFDAPSFVSGVNYLEETNVAANGSGDIVIVGTDSSSNNYTPYNGIGIMAVPEPSAASLLLSGLGVAAGLQMIRHRRLEA